MANRDYIVLGQVDHQDLKLGEVRAVSLPPETEDLVVKSKETVQVFKPESGKYFKTVTVDAVSLDKPDQSKTTVPTKERQIIKADVGYELAENIVEPIPDMYADITNVDATAEDVLNGKTFVDNQGNEVQGTAELKEDLDAELTSQEEAITNLETAVDRLPEPKMETYYEGRPSWYPDIREILNTAPTITVEEVPYYPLCIILMSDRMASTPFYKANSTTSSEINYLRGTSGNAVLCSDVYNPDGSNNYGLEIGTEILHTWNAEKDIYSTKNPNERVRWAIIYGTAKQLNSNFQVVGWFEAIEIITGDTILNQGTMGSTVSGFGNYYTGVKYIEIQPQTKATSSQFYCEKFLYGCLSLTELKFLSSSIKTITGNSGDFVYDCPNLKKVTLSESLKNFSCYSTFGKCHIEYINTENIVNINNCRFMNFNKGNAFIDFSSLTSITTGYINCGFSPYVKLPQDFDISGLSFSTNASLNNKTKPIAKSIQWLKDICVMLKDRTGEDAGSIILGTANLDNANVIYLTFNPNNKRDIVFDGVTAETEGAVSITDFITNQLNWTLS